MWRSSRKSRGQKRSAVPQRGVEVWSRLRRRQLGRAFTKQFQIGGSVADFACRAAKLVIELDGGQHDRLARADAARTQKIEAYSYKVIRYWNSDVMENLDGVLEGDAPLLPLGGLVTLTVFADPRVDVQGVGATTTPAGYVFTARATLH